MAAGFTHTHTHTHWVIDFYFLASLVPTNPFRLVRAITITNLYSLHGSRRCVITEYITPRPQLTAGSSSSSILVSLIIFSFTLRFIPSSRVTTARKKKEKEKKKKLLIHEPLFFLIII
jgi:hypothetical protein